jgi:hypothetical protein
MITDETGHAIAFSGSNDDSVIEAGLDDPDYGDPATEWTEWTDQVRYAATAADVAWLKRVAEIHQGDDLDGRVAG